MQLLFEGFEEGYVECFGLLFGVVCYLYLVIGIWVLYMGWNCLLLLCDVLLMYGVVDCVSVYFVYSYVVLLNEYIVVVCDYGGLFVVVVQCGCYSGVQFYFEWLVVIGVWILCNFIENVFL